MKLSRGSVSTPKLEKAPCVSLHKLKSDILGLVPPSAPQYGGESGGLEASGEILYQELTG